MKRFPLFLICIASAIAEPPGIEQSMECINPTTGGMFIRWYGKEGRSYFLQVSDPTDHLNKWKWAPIIERGYDEPISYDIDSTADKGFFRLKYADQVPGANETLDTADYDNDGLSNIDEISPPQMAMRTMLPAPIPNATDPLNPDTDGDGLPDGWEIANGLDANDPTGNNGAYGDPDGDGLTNNQEFAAGTNATVSDNPGIGQETITNGDFSSPVIGTGERSEVPDATWDYWSGGVDGWSAVNGSNIEYQTIDPIDTGNQYAELKGEPAGHTGIKQSIFTRKGGAYLLLFDCKARANTTLENNEFSVKVDGVAVQSITPTAAWGKKVVAFTATKIFTEISLVPENNVDDTKGCYVDNVSLLPVEIVPDEDMAGVVGDLVASVNPASTIQNFVSPKNTTEFPQEYVILKAIGITADQITPAHANQIVEWDGGEAVPNDPLKRRVKRDAAAKTVVKINVKQDGILATQMNVWVIWSDVTITNGTPSYGNYMGGALYEVTQDPGWCFIFKIQPASILDQTTLDRPKLSGLKSKNPPGSGIAYTIKPALGDGDTATNLWDVTRQYKVTIRNPGSIPKVDLQQGNVPAAWIANQPLAADTPVTYPTLDAEGNDDPKNEIIDEDTNPYQSFTTSTRLNHQIGELSSNDAPILRVLDGWGGVRRSYSVEYNFKEFARVELWDGKRQTGLYWFRISDKILWHHYLDATYDSATSKWNDASSSSGTGHPKP